MILASWAGTLGWLTWRVYHRGPATFTTGAAPILPPDAYFYTVRAAGSQVGVGTITIDTLADGVQITERLGLDLPIHPSSTRSQFTTQYTIGTDLGLREFRITLPADEDPVVQHGVFEADTSLTISPGTGEPRWKLRLSPGSLTPPLAATVTLALQQKLRTGERLLVPVFDPATLTRGNIRLRVIDDSVFTVPDSAEFDSLGGAWVPVHSDTLRGWKIEWSNANQNILMWVDSRGVPIQIDAPAGLSYDRSAFEITTINYRRRRGTGSSERPGSVLPQSTIASRVVPDPRVSEMRVRVRSRDLLWELPADTASAFIQRMVGDTLVTAVASWDSARFGFEIPSRNPVVAGWLSDEPLLGIEDTAIVHRARGIVGTERDAARAAAALVNWVHTSIDRVPSSVVPRAATVLRTRQADVDGHTVLLVALARAAGIPARPVSGIVLAGEKFYLHSWAEVFVGQWVPVDPTWDGVPASADRIRFTVGSLARPLDLLPLMAGLDVELLTLTRRP